MVGNFNASVLMFKLGGQEVHAQRQGLAVGHSLASSWGYSSVCTRSWCVSVYPNFLL